MSRFMMAYGLASIMLCTGMLLRARILFFQKMLVPASVIGGVIGFLLMNILAETGITVGTNAEMYTAIVNELFTISFISISLTGTSENVDVTAKTRVKGAVGLGLVWCLLYALTPMVAAVLLSLIKGTDMDIMYGMLVPFAFCQGPGQSAAYGAIFETYGWDNAATVAITFSVVGFIAAFSVGISMAKAGIRKGIAKNCGKIETSVLKGYFSKEEQTEYMVKDTTCSSNIETLAFHFALIGICYVMAVGIARILSHIPGFLGTSMSSMMFMNGMYAAYIVKWLMRKLKLDFLQENSLQCKITGWTSDYLVVCAFMAVPLGIIKKWIIPILLVSAVITVVTLVVCIYFGQRFGGSNDFERTLGLYGTCTGTVPSGIALVRIVDPNFRTTTSIELGACNLVMLASTPVYIIILGLAAGSIGMLSAMLGLLVCVVVYLVALKLFKVWGMKSFSWK